MTTQDKPSKTSPRDLLLLHATLLVYAAVSIFAKLAAGALTAEATARTLLFLGLELVTLLVYSVMWQQTLKRMPLNVAYSSKGVCTLWTCLFGVAFFGESITWGKAAGILIVLVGVALVVSERE